MSHSFTTISAAEWPIEQVADLLTRSFEGYFYPLHATADMLAQRIEQEQIVLAASPILLVDELPVGLALVGLRGALAWCGGFGIVAPQRGRGYSAPLAEAMFTLARTAGASRFTLEVLTRNPAAVHVYLRAGLRIARELVIYEWRGFQQRPNQHGPALVERDPAVLVAAHHLHPVPPAWQRNSQNLVIRPSLVGFALETAGQIAGYAIGQRLVSDGLRLLDFAAADLERARELLRGLQTRASLIVSVNEPSDSPLTPAFASVGFREIDRQYEMEGVL